MKNSRLIGPAIDHWHNLAISFMTEEDRSRLSLAQKSVLLDDYSRLSQAECKTAVEDLRQHLDDALPAVREHFAVLRHDMEAELDRHMPDLEGKAATAALHTIMDEK